MDSCPSDEDLNSFLSGDGLVEVGVHLRSCHSCLQGAERLSDDYNLRRVTALLADPTWDWAGGTGLNGIVEDLQRERPFLEQSGLPGITEPTKVMFDPPEVSGMLGRLGPYDVEQEIGRGGMGVVFRARDRTTGRVVALKILLSGPDDARTRRRFIHEVRAAAKVEHDHVVRLYATSDPDDRVPYFAMEYLSGESLAEVNRKKARIDSMEAAEIIAQVASGLQAAHLAGLVHSDVKPANILFDPATSRAKIGDFGLARVEADESHLSRDGLLAGTPAYLSPEQARGGATADPRSDIYSLGVTLYESLTGEIPFRGEPHRIIHQVIHDDPQPPRVFNDAIPKDLETICLKAMAKEPSKRYSTASAFSDDLRRFLQGEPIQARPVGAIERNWTWCRNHRTVAGLALFSVTALVILALGSTVAAVWISRERFRAIEQTIEARTQRGLAFDAFNSLIEGVQNKLASRPGSLELRRSLLEIARDGLSKMARDGSKDTTNQVDERTVTALIKLGDLDLILGRTAEAADEFTQAARMAEQALTLSPDSVPLRRTQAMAYDRLGDQDRREYSLDKHLSQYYERSYKIRQTLLAEHSTDPIIRRDLCVSQTKLGDTCKAVGDYSRARELYLASLKATLEGREDPTNRSLRWKDLRFIHGRIGLLARQEARGQEAMESLRDAIAAADTLCKIDPADIDSRRQRAFCLDYHGVACLEFGELAGAELSLSAFRDDRKAAVEAEPDNKEALRSLALSYQHLGNLESRRARSDEARKLHLAAAVLFDNLAARDPASIGAHKDRLMIRRHLMENEAQRDDFDAATRWLDQELEIQAGNNVPKHDDQLAWIEEARRLREIYSLARKAIADPQFAGSQPLPLRNALLQILTLALARAGRVEEADLAARELLSQPGDPGGAIVAARAYGLIIKSLAKDHDPRRETFILAAIEACQKAINEDQSLTRRLQYDTFLESIRDHPQFRLLLSRSSSF